MSSHYGIDTSEDFGPLFRQASREVAHVDPNNAAVRSSSSGVQQVQRRPDGVGGAVPAMSMPGVQASRPAPARRTDPATSREPGRAARLRGQKAAVYEALGQGPGSQSELARRAGLIPHKVNKRLSDLEHEGLAEPTGEVVRNDGGFPERVWRRIG
jgi:hypothetical protein